ncbi:MAG: heme o synthase [Polaribacter sp.]
MKTATKDISLSILVREKMKAIALLFKLRLATFVVFSSAIGLLIASSFTANWFDVFVLSISGFLVTGASSAFNQIFEKDSDALMERTKNRPVVTGYFSKTEASLYAGIAAVIGLLTITLYFNEMAGLLAAVSLISYAFIYTPLKKVNSFAVFVGAIPGALPPMIGAVAFDGTFGFWALYLFAIQFIWQFPHFWAIAWVSFEDYKKADIMLLPAVSGRSKHSAFITLIYTVVLIPLGMYPFFAEKLSLISSVVVLFAAIYFLYFAILLFRDCTVASAKKLMFASFFYLPVILIAFLMGYL